MKFTALRTGLLCTLIIQPLCSLCQVSTTPGLSTSATVAKDTHHFTIYDDPALTSACLRARSLFLNSEPQWQRAAPNRLDFTLLILDPDGTVRRGGHGQENLAYPASCVKLPYMAAAMHWSRQNNLPPTALHNSVGPMITVSSNEATGEVVDAISGALNLDDLTTATDFRFRSWIDKRRYTERYLESRGLLGNQTIVHKTFPSNSGRSPRGAEDIARAVYGGNRMQPRLSASLMLELATGVLEPQAHGYMMQQLRHERFEDDSVVGWGLPPGTEYFNKPGVAYDTCEDIAFARLPNGRQIVLAVYSNSWDRGQPIPHDANRMGRFTEILLHQANLTEGLTTVYGFGDGFHGAPFSPEGNPTPHLHLHANTVSLTKDSFTSTSINSTTRTLSIQVPVVAGRGTTVPLATWTVPLPNPGHYEMAAFHPSGRDLATSAVVTIHHSDGATTIALNQRNGERRPKDLGTYRFGQDSWKSPAAAPTPSPTQAIVTIAAPEGQNVAVDAIRAQLWCTVPSVQDDKNLSKSSD